MQYGVWYVDPPYDFKTYSAKGTGRAAVSHYDVMTVDEIKAYFIAHRLLALPDCALFLWVPGTHTLHIGALMDAAGFTFAGTGFEWVKPVKAVAQLLADRRAGRPLSPGALGKVDWQLGNGYGTRKNMEFCWLGLRGSPQRLSKAISSVICEPRGQHSEKPAIVRDRIEALFPGPYLEMFARSTALGWHCIGDQVGLLDHGPVKTRRQPSSLVVRPQIRRDSLTASKV
jgi:N6-adenosine-specific RNA methylase IME4